MTSFVEEKKFLIIVHRRSRSGRRARSQTWSRSGMRPITSRRQHSYSCVKTEASKSSWPTPMRPTSGSRPSSTITQQKPPRKKKARALRSSGQVSFPVDFFEHCSQIQDLEFGGADVLQIYNVNQLRTRLQTASLYIANTKPGGFQLEVTNNDANQVC